MSSQNKLPLRVGLIGLSKSSGSGWGADAHLPALLADQGRKDYQIVALLNSSKESAQQAIADFGLSPDTKAYGNPSDLANDKDIDVVICSVRADKHYATTIASVRARKDAYIEWPIAASVENVNELLETAKSSGSRIAIGLQQRWTPPVVKLRELLQQGHLGKILSSSVTAYSNTPWRDEVPESRVVFTKKSVGASFATITFGHTIDMIQSVVGECVPGTTHARTQIQRKTRRITYEQQQEPSDQRPTTVDTEIPDLIIVDGSLTPSPTVAENATLSFHIRAGVPFPGQPALDWRLHCERGEISLTAFEDPFFQQPAYEYKQKPLLQVHNFQDDSVTTVEWEFDPKFKHLGYDARAVAPTLTAFAHADTSGYVSIDEAAVRAKQLDAWLTTGAW